MKIGRGSTRLKLGLVLGVALLAFAAVFVGSARAAETPPADASGLPADQGVAFDPLATNVPYLAWRGEEVRLVKCVPYDPSSYPGDENLGVVGSGVNAGFTGNDGGLDVNMTAYAFSGPEDDILAIPHPVTGTGNIFYDHTNHRLCVRGTWISDKPGILIVKLTVDYNGVIFLQHDFMVGWMAINTVTMTNAGTVNENPGTEPGNSANVVVTGSIPLNSEFQSDWGLPATLVMPRDWALWAKSGMASANMPYQYCAEYFYSYCTDWENNPYYGVPASAFWDIHDSSAPAALGVTDSPDVHVDQNTCPDSTSSAFIDQVDNCTGGETWFSRVFGDLTDGQNGPFDPAFASTLLSDGRLNAADAPMPALEIVYNTSGGMGFFDNSCLNDKDNVYNSQFDPTNQIPTNDDSSGFDCLAKGTTDENAAHALYAPYYGEYIPSTSRDVWGAASGIDSAFQTNNFQAFAGQYGLYNFWDAIPLTTAEGGDSGCLLNNQGSGPGDRGLNEGPTQVAEFTDEHGEARAQWQPGENADFFANFANNNGKGGCDIQGVTFPSQTITASAQYPYQPTANPTPAAGSITKVIANLFQKTISCVAEKNPDGSIVGYICTVTAQDIDGNGYVMNGEKVCLSSQGSLGDGSWYSYSNGTIGDYNHGNSICVYLSGGAPGDPAQAQADLLTTQGTIDITALFTGEKIVRDACVVYGAPGSTPGPCGAVGGSGTTTGSGSTTGSGTTGSGTTGSGTTGSGTTGGTTGSSGDKGNVTVAGNVKKANHQTHVASVQLKLTKAGRVLYVKVVSRSHTAKIRILLLNSKGHVVTKAVRTIRTGRSVKISNLAISKLVSKVHVVVLH